MVSSTIRCHKIWFEPLHENITSRTRSPAVQLFHATDHPSAITLMRWAKRRTDRFENRQIPGLESRL